jgi:hypothetical protein
MIRFVIGLLVVFGVAGGLDANPADEDLLLLIGLAVFGLGMMYSGTRSMNG